MIDLNDNEMIATLARIQSIATGEKVYAVDGDGKDAVYIAGEMCRWGMIDDIEIIYDDADAEKWDRILNGTRH